LVQEDSDFSEDSPRDKEMILFVRRYNLYTQKNGLKHNNQNLINFRMDKLKIGEHTKEEKVLNC